MQTTSEQLDGSAAQAGEVLLRQITLSRARELAKSEQYEAALVLLLQMEQTEAALDQRARIEAQRGQYDDARALWNEVLEQTPDHAGAKKGLRDIERALALKKALRGFAAGALVLAAGGLAVIALRPSAEVEPVKAHVQPAALPQPPAAAELLARGPEVAKPAAPAPAPSLPGIALPEGVSMRAEAGSQIYSFDGGLFVEGTSFVPGGRERVTALGRALAAQGESIQIELIGHIDTLPAPVEKQFHANTELALARAHAVLGRIARTTRIPADAVGLRAIGSRLGPYSAEQGDARNRTVDFRVSPR